MEEKFIPKGNWDNHKLLLRLALKETEGSNLPILELGCGDGSSPCLQEYSKETGRKVDSYDYDKAWAKKYNSTHVKDWDELDWMKQYSVALVDESPGEQRHKSIMLLMHTTDIIIVHDSEPAATAGYMLDKIWHLFKYKVDLVSNGAWATALSNKHDLSKWVGFKYENYEVKPWENRQELAFCCVAFGEKYVEQQARLKESILKFYPNANLFFYTDALPEGSKSFFDSLYGFKPWAVLAALNAGFRKIAFFDPACIVLDRLDYYDKYVRNYGVLAVKDDNQLKLSNRVRDYFTLPGDYTDNKNSVGGSFYYFDFNYELCRSIFNTWLECEEKGLFGTQMEAASEGLQGHCYDESCMALSLYLRGSEPFPYGGSRYHMDQNPIIDKRHFK